MDNKLPEDTMPKKATRAELDAARVLLSEATDTEVEIIEPVGVLAESYVHIKKEIEVHQSAILKLVDESRKVASNLSKHYGMTVPPLGGVDVPPAPIRFEEVSSDGQPSSYVAPTQSVEQIRAQSQLSVGDDESNFALNVSKQLSSALSFIK